ncbi:MAG TPA: hydrogenase maturation protease [Thermoanaerobaculia bacterium]|nr:hydrogenase maturation protease [Thermoanaerobaculia bacterium]
MSAGDQLWQEMASPGREVAIVGGRELRRGSRVRLAPRRRGDVLDLALAGRSARVEAIDEDQDGRLHLSVVLDDDPGRDLGDGRFTGHRFFFAADEVEPLDEPAAAPSRRLLVAGIGNVFLGDDGFGVAVAQALAGRELPAGVDVVDFGIRGMDLVYALGRGYDAAILVDALPSDQPPGILSVLEPELPDEALATFDSHSMDPVRVLAFARQLGPLPPRTLVVGCRPALVPSGDADDMVFELSEPVREAVGRAVELVRDLAGRFAAAGSFELVTDSDRDLDRDSDFDGDRDFHRDRDFDRGGGHPGGRREEKER